jgi:hypothetical protein
MRPIKHQPPVFDHLDLIRREPMTIARLKATLERGGLLDVQLLHEADDSCCLHEPWPATLAACLCRSSAEARQ